MHPLIVIPARLGSVRLPGKPLCKIDGVPLVEVVARNVQAFGLDGQIVVATDDRRVQDAVSDLDVQSVRTLTSHRSGTERVAEVAQIPEYTGFDPILNIQGDQPFLPRTAATGALNQIVAGFPIGTAAASLEDELQSDRNRVKVAVTKEGRALLFSRDMPAGHMEDRPTDVFLHLGIYAYTREALLNWVSLPPTTAEFRENLEQLRPFQHGTPIGVALVNEPVEAGIDTLEDLERAQSTISFQRTNA